MTLRPQTKAAQKAVARAANLPAILAMVADNVAEAAWLASVVVVALHFNLHTFTIFEADKIVMFKVLAALLLDAQQQRVALLRTHGHRIRNGSCYPAGIRWHCGCAAAQHRPVHRTTN